MAEKYEATTMAERLSAVQPPKSKAETTNPKDLVGNTKVSLSAFPAIAVAHGAHAMMDGARKYGPYNWRDKKVQARIYVDAAIRHIESWLEGEEDAPDSGVHHLGHAIACCAILLDAQATDTLIDNRPVNAKCKEAYVQTLKKLQDKIAAKLASIQAENGFEVVVNGDMKITRVKAIDYVEACRLANKDPNTCPTCTWHAPGGSGGSLTKGSTPVATVPGIILNVVHTGNA